MSTMIELAELSGATEGDCPAPTIAVEGGQWEKIARFHDDSGTAVDVRSFAHCSSARRISLTYPYRL
jgi:hypothetical protein